MQDMRDKYLEIYIYIYISTNINEYTYIHQNIHHTRNACRIFATNTSMHIYIYVDLQTYTNLQTYPKTYITHETHTGHARRIPRLHQIQRPPANRLARKQATQSHPLRTSREHWWVFGPVGYCWHSLNQWWCDQSGCVSCGQIVHELWHRSVCVCIGQFSQKSPVISGSHESWQNGCRWQKRERDTPKKWEREK